MDAYAVRVIGMAIGSMLDSSLTQPVLTLACNKPVWLGTHLGICPATSAFARKGQG